MFLKRKEYIRIKANTKSRTRKYSFEKKYTDINEMGTMINEDLISFIIRKKAIGIKKASPKGYLAESTEKKETIIILIYLFIKKLL